MASFHCKPLFRRECVGASDGGKTRWRTLPLSQQYKTFLRDFMRPQSRSQATDVSPLSVLLERNLQAFEECVLVISLPAGGRSHEPGAFVVEHQLHISVEVPVHTERPSFGAAGGNLRVREARERGAVDPKLAEAR